MPQLVVGLAPRVWHLREPRWLSRVNGDKEASKKRERFYPQFSLPHIFLIKIIHDSTNPPNLAMEVCTRVTYESIMHALGEVAWLSVCAKR